MKRRYLYALMFSVPGLLFAAISTVALAAAVAGVLWIFVFGDDTWPSFVHRTMSVLLFAVFACIWIALLAAAYAWGKRQEAATAMNRKHVVLALGSSAGLVLLALLHQLSAGNIGPRPDGVVCADFCAAKDFSSSGLDQDGTCRCIGSGSREEVTVSIESAPAESK